MPAKSKESRPLIPPLSIIYRKIAISFVALTVVLLGIIVFFSLSKATVAVIPKSELRSAEFLAFLGEASQLDKAIINGLWKEQIVEQEGQFETTGMSEKGGRAEGVITVINTTGVSQPLVATTRFLSDGGVLFRTKERVVVPAKGSVNAAVQADQPGAAGDIEPTRFTIPGLNSAKQKVIYGESKAAMTGGSGKVRVVTAEDLEKAKAALVERATVQAQRESEKLAGALGGQSVQADLLETHFDAKKGEERRTFTAKAKVKVQVLTYEKEALEKLAYEKVIAKVGADRELVKFNKDALVIRVKNVNKKTEEAQLSVYADAKVRLSSSSPLLDPAKLAGMLPEEAVQYLESFDAIEKVEVRLFPSWQRRVPTVPDRIKVVIKK